MDNLREVILSKKKKNTKQMGRHKWLYIVGRQKQGDQLGGYSDNP